MESGLSPCCATSVVRAAEQALLDVVGWRDGMGASMAGFDLPVKSCHRDVRARVLGWALRPIREVALGVLYCKRRLRSRRRRSGLLHVGVALHLQSFMLCHT